MKDLSLSLCDCMKGFLREREREGVVDEEKPEWRGYRTAHRSGRVTPFSSCVVEYRKIGADVSQPSRTFIIEDVEVSTSPVEPWAAEETAQN